MTRSANGRLAATLLTTLVAPGLAAQNAGPKEVGAKLTGGWKLNVELTPTSATPGRGGFADDIARPFAALVSVQQRGGRGGGGGGTGRDEASARLPAAEVAAQAALSILHEVPLELHIEASADAIMFRVPRGEWRFTIDGKSSTMEVPGATLRTRSRWDHGQLRQEFSTAQRGLVKTWSIDANDRLVLVEKIESLTFRSQSKAVFDRQP
jgi:hypothetical protein